MTANLGFRTFRGGMFHSKSDMVSTLELVYLPCGQTREDTRRPRRFHPSWLYCSIHNCCEESLFIYGPRHLKDGAILPTSLFLLESGASTPSRWDCKGMLVPLGRHARVGGSIVDGPVAFKYRDLRRVVISMVDGIYRCPRIDKMLREGQIDFAVPSLRFEELLECHRERVIV